MRQGSDVATFGTASGLPGAAERRVIIASSVGTVFEWYDFYLYAILAPFFAGLFFPPGNQTAALLGAFGAYAAGFLVRPFGALIFGRVGDLVGRKYTFLVTIVVMGLSTVCVGFLPTYSTIGFAAPLIIIGVTRVSMPAATFGTWGWRIAFWFSIPLLAISIYIRLKLQESPIFARMKALGKRSKQPLTESFLRYPNNQYVALALFGATAGQGVVWYTGQFYALFFILIYLKLDFIPTYSLIGISLVIGTPFFLLFGWLSDKIGRKKIILTGCLIAAVTYFPLFRGLTHYINPALEQYQQKTPITVAASDCNFHIFIGPWSRQTECDKVKDFLGKSGLSFASLPSIPGQAPVVTKIGDSEIRGWDEKQFKELLASTNYPTKANTAQMN